MKIYSVYDEEFKPYGKVIEKVKCDDILAAMEKIEMPATGIDYQPSIESLEACKDEFEEIKNRVFGGMPVQLGMCWGNNTKLNCLEYHRDSEFNIATGDFILLLAKVDQLNDFTIDSSLVKAFRVPAKTFIEIYSTTLHYAPCNVKLNEGFRMLCALPLGTNNPCPDIKVTTKEDTLLCGTNKWLIAHPESDEAKQGKVIGIKGENIDILPDIE